MKVVLLPAPYTPARAAAGLAAGRAARPSLLVPGGVVVPPDPLPPAPDGADGLALPVVRADRHVLGDGRIKAFGLARAVSRAAERSGPEAVVVVDATSPAFGLLDHYGDKAAEVSRVVARAFYWHPDPPIVVQFCHPPLLGFHLREWLRLVSGDPLETLREDLLIDPSHRLRFHLGYAELEYDRHNPVRVAKRTVRARVGRHTSRLKFWNWFRQPLA